MALRLYLQLCFNLAAACGPKHLLLWCGKGSSFSCLGSRGIISQISPDLVLCHGSLTRTARTWNFIPFPKSGTKFHHLATLGITPHLIPLNLLNRKLSHLRDSKQKVFSGCSVSESLCGNILQTIWFGVLWCFVIFESLYLTYKIISAGYDHEISQIRIWRPPGSPEQHDFEPLFSAWFFRVVTSPAITFKLTSRPSSFLSIAFFCSFNFSWKFINIILFPAPQKSIATRVC